MKKKEETLVYRPTCSEKQPAFLALPIEIIEIIASFLFLKDLGNFGLVNQLFHSISQDERLLKSLIENLPYEKGKKIFEKALSTKKTNILKLFGFIADGKIEVSTKVTELINDEKSTYLHIMAFLGSTTIVRNIFKQNILSTVINQLNSATESALSLAISRNNYDMVAIFLENGATYNVNDQTKSCLYYVFYLSDFGSYIDNIKYLLFTNLKDSKNKIIITEELCTMAVESLTDYSYFERFVMETLFKQYINKGQAAEISKRLVYLLDSVYSNKFKCLLENFNHLLQHDAWKSLYTILAVRVMDSIETPDFIAYKAFFIKTQLNYQELLFYGKDFFEQRLLRTIEYSLKENDIESIETLINKYDFYEIFKTKILQRLQEFLKVIIQKNGVNIQEIENGIKKINEANHGSKDLRSILTDLINPVAIMLTEETNRKQLLMNEAKRKFEEEEAQRGYSDESESEEEENNSVRFLI